MAVRESDIAKVSTNRSGVRKSRGNGIVVYRINSERTRIQVNALEKSSGREGILNVFGGTNSRKRGVPSTNTQRGSYHGKAYTRQEGQAKGHDDQLSITTKTEREGKTIVGQSVPVS